MVQFSPSDNSCDWLAVFLVENCGFGRPQDGGFKGGGGGGWGGGEEESKKTTMKQNKLRHMLSLM